MKQRLSTLKLLFVLIFLVIGLLVVNVVTPDKMAFAAADSCTPPSTTYGTDTMTMSVKTAGTYTIWTRMLAPSTSSNSILLNITNPGGNSASCYNVGGASSIPAGSWTWVNYNDGSASNVIKVSLSPGNYTFTLTGTEAGVGIDRIEALSDNTCVPTGTGDNCTPVSDTTPPTVSLSAPAAGATVSGASVAVSASATDNVAVASVQFRLDGANLGGVDSSSPYGYTWDTTGVSNGSHALSAIATDTSGNTTTSSPVTVTVNNAATAPSTVKNLAWNASTKTLSWTAYPGADTYNIATVRNPTTTRDTTYTSPPVSGTSYAPPALIGTTVNYGILPEVKNSDGSYSGMAGASWATEVTVTWPAASDTTPPTTTISSGPASSTTATTASFSFTGTDNVTAAGSLTFQCSLDSGAYAACTSPKAYSGLAVGSHTFNVKATDGAGNTDATAASQTWSVTAVAVPSITGDLDGSGTVTGHDLSILLSHYGTSYAPGEFDKGNTVEGHDLSILLSNYGK